MRPLIYEYDDYRQFLSDSYKYLKNKKPQFSYRYFSKKAGFTSPNYLKLIIDGKRNLSVEAIPKIANAIELKPSETKFLTSLVLFNQATTPKEQLKYSEKIFRTRSVKRSRPITAATFEYLTHWYYVAIRELFGIIDRKITPGWIARKLTPSIKVKEAQDAIDHLVELGFLRKNSDGNYSQAESHLSTADSGLNFAMAAFHEGMIVKGKEAIERFPREIREISSVSLRISSEEFEILREKIIDFRENFIETSEHDSSDRVYQLNIQFFPLSEKLK